MGSTRAAPCRGPSPTSGRIKGRTDRMNAAAASSSSIGPIATSMISSRGSIHIASTEACSYANPSTGGSRTAHRCTHQLPDPL